MAGKLQIEEQEIQEIVIGNIDPIYLHVTSCRVSSRARMIKHPIENGKTIFDNKVLDPRVISINAVVDAKDRDVQKQLREMWRERHYEFYTITTREAQYMNFACTECTHSESAEKLDVLEYTIQFEEVMMAKSRKEEVEAASPDDANVS